MTDRDKNGEEQSGSSFKKPVHVFWYDEHGENKLGEDGAGAEKLARDRAGAKQRAKRKFCSLNRLSMSRSSRSSAIINSLRSSSRRKRSSRYQARLMMLSRSWWRMSAIKQALTLSFAR
ncbi:hypothetical protein [Paenibacillus albus]|uniref:hypothetical protein n=1 Tax=Paenibacillus albus TaxID=2495582 RepID=UPI001D131A94|nr:hypothetical protein [Paenibacillus albus]